MSWQAIQMIAFKDLRVVAQSKPVLIPMILVPLILLVVMPLGFGLMISSIDTSSADFAELSAMLDQLPGSALSAYGTLTEVQQILIYMLTYFLAPLFLIVPLLVANVIAADSFVGEKERKTLEALLYTPTSDSELFIGKILAPWLAAICVSLVGFIGYAVVVNVIGVPIVGFVFFPNAMWLVLILWVAPAIAGLGLGVMVLLSARVNTFQEAYQLGSMVVLPVVLLMLGQTSGILFFSTGFVIIIGLVLWVIDIWLLWASIRGFTRSRLLERL